MDAVEGNGGKVLKPPHKSGAHGSRAVILDRTGRQDLSGLSPEAMMGGVGNAGDIGAMMQALGGQQIDPKQIQIMQLQLRPTMLVNSSDVIPTL